MTHPERMLVTIHGPNGEHLQAGEHIPQTWDRDYVESLIADGAAGLLDDVAAAELLDLPAADNIVTTGFGG